MSQVEKIGPPAEPYACPVQHCYEVGCAMADKPQFEIGDKVYMRFREEKTPGIVVGINIRSECRHYVVAWPHLNGDERCYDAIELAAEHDPAY